MFDCSGLIVWALQKLGSVNGDYFARDLYANLCVPISKNELKSGDLCFEKKDTITHVGIYDNGKVIHARGTNYGVVETELYDSFNVFGRLKGGSTMDWEQKAVEFVKAFQKKFGLVTDGKAGEKTFATLNELLLEGSIKKAWENFIKGVS